MDEDDELLELMAQKQATDDDELLALMGADEPEQAAAPEAPVDTGLVPQGLEHALKGYPKMLTGIADLPGMAYGALTWPTRKGLNYLGVDEEITDKWAIPTLSEQEFMKPALEWMDNTPGVEKGDAADYAQTAVEWGGLGPISAARKGATAIPDLFMAVGAPAGEYLAGEFGEVGGGFAGLLAALRRGKGVDKALDTINESVSGKSDDVVESVTEGVAAGETGTLADLSGDQGVMNLEETASRGPREQEYAARELERQQQIADEVRAPFGDADPDAARQAAQERITGIADRVREDYVPARQEQVTVPIRAEQQAAVQADAAVQAERLAAQEAAGLEKAAAAQAQQATAQAATEAEGARAALATDQTLAETSVEMSGLYNAARAEQKAATVDPHWDEFDNLTEVPVADYSATVKEFIEGLPPSQKKKFAEHKGTFSALIDKKITEMTPKEIQDVLVDMRSVIASAYQRGKPNTSIKNLEKLYRELDGQLAGTIPSYKAAKEGESLLRQRFDDGMVGDNRTVEPELFARSIGQSDEVGALSGRLLAQADVPGMPEAVANRLRALASRSQSGVDEVFMKEYESLMNTLPPEFQQQAQAVVDTSRAVEGAAAAEDIAAKTAQAAETQAQAAVKASEVSAERTAEKVAGLDEAAKEARLDVTKRGKGLEESVAQSNVAKYTQNREATLLKMLKNPDDVSDLVALQRSMDRLGQTDSFNADLGRVILNKLSSGGAEAGLRKATGEAPVLTAKAIEDFEKIGASLVEAGADPAMIQQVRASLHKLATKQQRANARKLVMNSDRHVANLLSSGVAAATLKALPGSSLVMAGAVRRGIRAALAHGGSSDAAIHAAVDDFMLNPEKYVKAMAEAKSPAKAQQILMSEIVAAGQAYQAD